MKIEDQRVRRTVNFGDLGPQDVFEDDGEFFMKTAEDWTHGGETPPNAICLSDGELWHFTEDERVIQVNGRIVIERNA